MKSARALLKLRWILLLSGVVTVFYWKIVFTKQFSILWQWEPVTQSYSWYNFASTWIQKGVLPIWDPYRFSGNTFIGEMQTGLFYPLKFLVYLTPLDRNGMVSERIYNEFYVLTHVLAAVFMFLLARHLRLSNFASSVAGLSFSLGGFLANTGHPHMLDSGIWLPLTVLFFLRSSEEISNVRGVFFASLSGLSVGMMVLAGGIHMVIMAGIVIATMSAVLLRSTSRRSRLVAMAGVVAIMGFLFAGIQLLPSMEYAPLSFRWVGGDSPIRFPQKVPYQFLGGLARFSPRSLVAFLFGAADPGDHHPSNYFGVLPFFLSIIGAWRARGEKLVPYFATIAVVAYVYGWGEFSFLHGILYLAPGLDIAREAGRFIFVTHFATAILAGYGIDQLFHKATANDAWMSKFVRAVRWLTIFLLALLIAGSVQSSIAIADWFFISFAFVATAYLLLEFVSRGHRSAVAKFLLLFLLLWDVYEFQFPIRNRAIAQAAKQDYMADLLSSRKLAEFFRSKGSLFRIHFDAEAPPNLGDSYEVPMTGGMSATMFVGYLGYLGHPQMPKLLNVRYTLRRTADPGGAMPVFSDGEWRVYENPDFGPRAWVVHSFVVEQRTDGPPKRVNDPTFEPSRVAVLDQPLLEPLDSEIDVQTSHVQTTHYDPMSIEFQAQTKGRGILVVSEVFYPGWEATVDGRPAAIYRVDGLLRGVTVPAGDSTIRLEYRPHSLRAGSALSLTAIFVVFVSGLMARRKRVHVFDSRSTIPGLTIQDQMRVEWDQRAKQDARHFVATQKKEWTDEEFFESGYMSLQDQVLPDLKRFCGNKPLKDLKVLEIGCGAGRMTRALSAAFGHVAAVDISPSMISQARATLKDCSNVEFHVNNGIDLSMFPADSFDFVVSTIVFQHIPRRAIVENYIAEAGRVLRRGSLFRFQVQGCFIPEEEANSWVGVGFTREQMDEIAAATGFEVMTADGAGTQYFWLSFFKP